MNEHTASHLFDFAELILAVGRQIHPAHDRSVGMCTPVESAVMRFINRSPGTSARAASEATLLPFSNLSRVVRGLEVKRLVRREVDPRDARCVRLYLTAQAEENLQHLRDTWSRTLQETVDPAAFDGLNAALRQIENELNARRQA